MSLSVYKVTAKGHDRQGRRRAVVLVVRAVSEESAADEFWVSESVLMDRDTSQVTIEFRGRP